MSPDEPGVAEEPYVPAHMGTDQDFAAHDYLWEPVRVGADVGVIAVMRDIQAAKVMSLDDLYSNLEKGEADRVSAFAVAHAGDWEYPSGYRPGDILCLEGVGAAEGPLSARLEAVAEKMRAYLGSHIVFGGKNDVELVIAFIVSTYLFTAFEYAPRLLISGVTNSGKSTLMDVLRELCYRANFAADTTEASLFRVIDECQVTAILDEFQDYSKPAQADIKKILKGK